MKKTKKQITRRRKLSLAKQTVRKLTSTGLSNAAGGAHTDICGTVTFPKCCLTI
jgi:hypothetical protein